MTLYINTASNEEIIIALKEGERTIAQKRFLAPRRQAEKLLPEIDKLLRAKKVKLDALDKIIVANRGGSFTSLRIGVITANALAYALKIPVVAGDPVGKKNKKFGSYSIVEPIYDREPNIGKAKKGRL